MLAFIHSSHIFFCHPNMYDMETHIDYRTLNIIQQIKYAKLDIQKKSLSRKQWKYVCRKGWEKVIKWFGTQWFY